MGGTGLHLCASNLYIRVILYKLLLYLLVLVGPEAGRVWLMGCKKGDSQVQKTLERHRGSVVRQAGDAWSKLRG